jgi:hypothetical protein
MSLDDDPVHRDIIRLAQEAHRRHWRMAGNVGLGDRLAATVTMEWQRDVENKYGSERFIRERPVGELREHIDLVDTVNGVAYELKVSPNNDHFEFYRDIFKVLIARDNGLPQLRSFCFLCPEVTAARYNAGLRRAVINEGQRLGLSIFVAAV